MIKLFRNFWRIQTNCYYRRNYLIQKAFRTPFYMHRLDPHPAFVSLEETMDWAQSDPHFCCSCKDPGQ